MLRRVGVFAVAAFLGVSFLTASAQKLAWQKDAQSQSGEYQFVQFLYPEEIQVPAGKATVVDLHFRVNDGMHVNSHTPTLKSLIPTQLMVNEPNGVDVANVDFPPGTEYATAFDPGTKLSVYTGEFILHAHVKAQAGQHLVQGVLRYQACDANSCYPPRKAPVAINVIAK